MVYKVPVFPVFLSEVEEGRVPLNFITFDSKVQFPDAPHVRGPYAQSIINSLAYEQKNASFVLMFVQQRYAAAWDSISR